MIKNRPAAPALTDRQIRQFHAAIRAGMTPKSALEAIHDFERTDRTDRLVAALRRSMDRHSRRVIKFDSRRQQVTPEQDHLLKQSFNLSSRLSAALDD